ncbi:hypothetical protein D3C75_229270 [compost metagenome]
MNCLVFDGHDCSGKSTLSSLFVKRHPNSVYIRPFEKNIGELFWWLYTKKEYELANNLALNSVRKAAAEKDDNSLLVFDRHWLTLFSILPEQYWEAWVPLPKTILCWTDPINTNLRMEERGEKELYDGYNEYYCNYYLKLARQFGVKILDTSNKTQEESLNEVILYLSNDKESYEGESKHA